jgi:hypothetical protein
MHLNMRGVILIGEHLTGVEVSTLFSCTGSTAAAAGPWAGCVVVLTPTATSPARCTSCVVEFLPCTCCITACC